MKIFQREYCANLRNEIKVPRARSPSPISPSLNPWTLIQRRTHHATPFLRDPMNFLSPVIAFIRLIASVLSLQLYRIKRIQVTFTTSVLLMKHSVRPCSRISPALVVLLFFFQEGGWIFNESASITMGPSISFLWRENMGEGEHPRLILRRFDFFVLFSFGVFIF